MKVTALIENKSSIDMAKEHGLAVHIEYKGKEYLLDTGASNHFIENAFKLGIDLGNIEAAILSHSHYDHSGGFDGFFSKNKNAKVYLQSTAREFCYYKLGLISEYIGIPAGILDKYSERFIYIDGDYKLDDGIWLISHKDKDLKSKGKKDHMYRKNKDGMIPDDFQHEQSLVFETENGLVILNSCCHAGVDTIIEEVKENFHGREVLAIIGGFHLMGISGTNSINGTQKDIRDLGKRLNALNVKHIYTGHCTGDPAFELLKEELGEKLQYFSTGTIVEL